MQAATFLSIKVRNNAEMYAFLTLWIAYLELPNVDLKQSKAAWLSAILLNEVRFGMSDQMDGPAWFEQMMDYKYGMFAHLMLII